MKRLLVVALSALITGLAGVQSADAAHDLWVSPTDPTTADSVKVFMGIGYTSVCGQPPSAPACTVVSPDTLSIEVVADNVGPFCLDFPATYERFCNFGLLAPGTYVARSTEVHPHSSDEEQTSTSVFSFTVSAPTPTLRRSWVKVKSSYR